MNVIQSILHGIGQKSRRKIIEHAALKAADNARAEQMRQRILKTGVVPNWICRD